MNQKCTIVPFYTEIENEKPNKARKQQPFSTIQCIWENKAEKAIIKDRKIQNAKNAANQLVEPMNCNRGANLEIRKNK